MNLEKTALGIEFGSTRIKAVLLDEDHNVISTGGYTWENRLENGIWTYDLDHAVKGMQASFSILKQNFEAKYNIKLTTIGAIGISGMMHGYLPFDEDMRLLAPFRTWRNVITKREGQLLTDAFSFTVPLRWSICHLYKDILEDKPYVKDIRFMTTLSGYIHWLLTGNKVLGAGEASGMFPLDRDTLTFNKEYLDIFDELVKEKNYPWQLKQLLPKVLSAGCAAGTLTAEGAKLLDITGELSFNIPFAPPEGDGPTGMVATNSVKVNTGNVSAGTSIFAMLVVNKLPRMHKGIDIIFTPQGLPCLMVQANNCSTDINGWAGLFSEFAGALGVETDMDTVYTVLFNKALEGKPDCGGLLSCNYFSGETLTDLSAGVPIFMRRPDSTLTLADFMRTHIYSAFATLKIGLDMLKNEENVQIEELVAHGGLFKTPAVGQTLLSAVANAKVTVSETATEGGPYGMALLASFLLEESNITFEAFLDKVFATAKTVTVMATQQDIDGFDRFMAHYKKALSVERLAVEGDIFS